MIENMEARQPNVWNAIHGMMDNFGPVLRCVKRCTIYVIEK